MLIEELGGTVRTSRPGQCGNRIDDLIQVTFARPDGILRTLPVVDIGVQGAPAKDASIASRTGSPRT